MKTVIETTANFEAYELEAKLIDICNAITNIGLPSGSKQVHAVAEVRKLAAAHLHELGYSHRQIMNALGLKSPQSVSVYLNEKEQ